MILAAAAAPEPDMVGNRFQQGRFARAVLAREDCDRRLEIQQEILSGDARQIEGIARLAGRPFAPCDRSQERGF
jgi:hypothetical protein